MAFETHAVDFGVQMVVREYIDPPRRQGLNRSPCHHAWPTARGGALCARRPILRRYVRQTGANTRPLTGLTALIIGPRGNRNGA